MAARHRPARGRHHFDQTAREQRRRQRLVAQPDDPAGGDPGEALALGGLIDSLSTEQRDAFVVTQVLGLSYADAATVCGCPVGTIRSRVARARDRLIVGYAADSADDADKPARRRRG